MRGDKVVETSLPSDLKKPKMVKKDPMDVEMKDAESPSDDKEEPKKDADLLTLEGKTFFLRHFYEQEGLCIDVEMSVVGCRLCVRSFMALGHLEAV